MVAPPWLYGLVILIPLVWRDRAPVTVFITQWVLAVAAWPIMSHYTPVVGISVALYAVSVHRSKKTSVLALLASFISIGLAAAVAFRIPNDDSFTAFINNAIYLALIAVGAWGAGRMTRAKQQHIKHQTKPRAGQLSLEASVP